MHPEPVGVAVPGGQLVRRGQRPGPEPELVVPLAPPLQRTAEHRRDAVGAQVAVPGPVHALVGQPAYGADQLVQLGQAVAGEEDVAADAEPRLPRPLGGQA